MPRPVREALVCWEHGADYPLPKSKDWTAAGGGGGFVKTYKLGEEHAFLADHVVDGRILMPVRARGPHLPPSVYHTCRDAGQPAGELLALAGASAVVTCCSGPTLCPPVKEAPCCTRGWLLPGLCMLLALRS